MSDEQWIVVPNWDKFQHYRDRSPTWIKLYLELNSRDDWLDLTLHERGVLVTIWLDYARTDGVLHVGRYVRTHDNRYGNIMRALNSLVQAGFIRLSASKPLAQRREEKNNARAREKEPPKPKPRQPAETRTNAAAYQPFNTTTTEDIEVDQATLELARRWLRPQ